MNLRPLLDLIVTETMHLWMKKGGRRWFETHTQLRDYLTENINKALQKELEGFYGWQPIATISKVDGMAIDLWVKFERGERRVPNAFWIADRGIWQLGRYTEAQFDVKPIITHWMQLERPNQ